jgi:hypothetical protein
MDNEPRRVKLVIEFDEIVDDVKAVFSNAGFPVLGSMIRMRINNPANLFYVHTFRVMTVSSNTRDWLVKSLEKIIATQKLSRQKHRICLDFSEALCRIKVNVYLQ